MPGPNMKASVFILSLFYFITTEAYLRIEESASESLEEPVIQGNLTQFATVLIIKPDKTVRQDKPLEELDIKKYGTEIEDMSISHEGLNIEPESSLLRGNPFKSCQKKGALVCKRACIAAAKTACSYRDCHRRLKETLKKECKRSCTNYFMGHHYDHDRSDRSY